MLQSSGCWVGVDVSKAWLDVVFRSDGIHMRVPNMSAGFREILRQLRSMTVAGIVVESTGFYHRGMVEALAQHEYSPSIVNPKHIKEYRKSGLKMAKNDQLDARILARFGEERHPPVMFPKQATWQQLADLVSARRDYVKGKGQWTNRRKNPHLPASVQNQADAIILNHDAAIVRLTAEIETIIAADPVLAHRSALLQSIPGIALVRSAVLLAYLPELGTLPNNVLTSLVGLVPHANDSGQRSGHRYVRRGRGAVKGELVLLVRTPRVAPNIVSRRRGFLDRGKPADCADVAVARWLLAIINTMVRDDLMWKELDINKNQ